MRSNLILRGVIEITKMRLATPYKKPLLLGDCLVLAGAVNCDDYER